MSRYEQADYPAYMRSQSKNALKAMAAALKSPAVLPADHAARIEVDALCAELDQREIISQPFIGRRIATAVAKAHGISFRDLIGKRRLRYLVRARQEAMYLMVRFTTLSLPQIGTILGDRDHTTILYGARVHAHRLANAKS
jgi:chromosomal replication initiation ATPase DnaA